MAVKITVNRLARNLSASARHYAMAQGVDPSHTIMMPIRDLRNNYLYMTVGVDQPIDWRQWTSGIREQFAREYAHDSPYNLVVQQVQTLESVFDGVSLEDGLELIDLPDSDG